MYGKYFASTFTGSMFGAGCEVFALWGYIIASTVDSTVELNPTYLAAVLGATPEQVGHAIAALCAPDTRSRTPVAKGARLVHEQAFTYTVVNHSAYRAIRNEEDRRAYNREAKRKQRAKTPTNSHVKRDVNDNAHMSNMSAHTEAEAEAEAETKETPDVLVPVHQKAQQAAPSALDEGFKDFWTRYPKKIGKGAALKAWKKLKPSRELQDRIDSAVDHQSGSDQWRKDNGQFIPHPATWLNQGRWDDEPTVTTVQPMPTSRPTTRETSVNAAGSAPGARHVAFDADWWEECKAVHDGACDGDRMKHHLRMQTDALKANHAASR